MEHEYQLIGGIGLTKLADSFEIGSFAIALTQQNAGYGRILLDFAEDYIKQNSVVKILSMSVLNVRSELTAYYERHGYKATGAIEEYPIDADVGTPLVPLKLVLLEKTVG